MRMARDLDIRPAFRYSTPGEHQYQVLRRRSAEQSVGAVKCERHSCDHDGHKHPHRRLIAKNSISDPLKNDSAVGIDSSVPGQARSRSVVQIWLA